ncbi:uncharacterized protein LOC144722802 isoform X2 [Lampetra planeri]
MLLMMKSRGTRPLEARLGEALPPREILVRRRPEIPASIIPGAPPWTATSESAGAVPPLPYPESNSNAQGDVAKEKKSTSNPDLTSETMTLLNLLKTDFSSLRIKRGELRDAGHGAQAGLSPGLEDRSGGSRSGPPCGGGGVVSEGAPRTPRRHRLKDLTAALRRSQSFTVGRAAGPGDDAPPHHHHHHHHLLAAHSFRRAARAAGDGVDQQEGAFPGGCADAPIPRDRERNGAQQQQQQQQYHHQQHHHHHQQQQHQHQQQQHHQQHQQLREPLGQGSSRDYAGSDCARGGEDRARRGGGCGWAPLGPPQAVGAVIQSGGGGGGGGATSPALDEGACTRPAPGGAGGGGRLSESCDGPAESHARASAFKLVRRAGTAAAEAAAAAAPGSRDGAEGGQGSGRARRRGAAKGQPLPDAAATAATATNGRGADDGDRDRARFHSDPALLRRLSSVTEEAEFAQLQLQLQQQQQQGQHQGRGSLPGSMSESPVPRALSECSFSTNSDASSICSEVGPTPRGPSPEERAASEPGPQPHHQQRPRDGTAGPEDGTRAPKKKSLSDPSPYGEMRTVGFRSLVDSISELEQSGGGGGGGGGGSGGGGLSSALQQRGEQRGERVGDETHPFRARSQSETVPPRAARRAQAPLSPGELICAPPTTPHLARGFGRKARDQGKASEGSAVAASVGVGVGVGVPLGQCKAVSRSPFRPAARAPSEAAAAASSAALTPSAKALHEAKSASLPGRNKPSVEARRAHGFLSQVPSLEDVRKQFRLKVGRGSSSNTTTTSSSTSSTSSTTTTGTSSSSQAATALTTLVPEAHIAGPSAPHGAPPRTVRSLPVALPEPRRVEAAGDACASPGREHVVYEDMRKHVILNLLDTERSYVESLQQLVEGYMRPLKQAENAGLCDPALVDDMFYQVPEILGHHECFLARVTACVESWHERQTVGDLLVESFSKELLADSYSAYIDNFPHAQEAVKVANKARASFSRFLEQCMRENREKQALADLMIKPVQRIPRYELLIKDLLKHTPEEHPDRPCLVEAQRGLHALASRINQGRREAEEATRHACALQRVEAAIEGLSELAVPGRRFIRQELVVEVKAVGSKKERCLFLFSDLLLCTTLKRKSGSLRRSSFSLTTAGSYIDLSSKYKLLWRSPLHELEVVKGSCELLVPAAREALQRSVTGLEEDTARLADIRGLVDSLTVPHQALDDALRDLLLSVQRDLSERHAAATAGPPAPPPARLELLLLAPGAPQSAAGGAGGGGGGPGRRGGRPPAARWCSSLGAPRAVPRSSRRWRGPAPASRRLSPGENPSS